jgi:hypothetical protein
MNTNLNKIAQDLYGKIQTRFPNIKLGDENAQVLSKKTDIPNARFFEFEYDENGRSLGTVAITLDENDGVIVQISGDLAEKKHPNVFKFIRSFRQFAKDRLLKFDVQNIGKDHLDKRDYEFRAKPKEEPVMPQEQIMENKLYGTSRMSYQDLGETKIIIKHSQPINLNLPAGRTMHIEGIWVENVDGERFKYPYKHLNGARALAEHIKHGGNPYDAIGQHITSLSEELAQLRKFKGYVTRNDALSEAMGDITSKVMERIESVKKEVHNLQRSAYYEQFVEGFEANEERSIPEDVMNDLIDRLTIRTFNEELKTAFPYIFKLVDENSIPVKELTPEDFLGEEDIEEGMLDKLGQGVLNLGKKLFKKGSTNMPKVPGVIDDLPLSTPNPNKGTIVKDFNRLPAEPGAPARPTVITNPDQEVLPNMQPGGKVKKIYTKKPVNPNAVTATFGKQGNLDLEPANDPAFDPERKFEEFMNNILVREDNQEGENTLFSPNKSTQMAAIDKFNEIMKTELKGGPGGINVIDSLKGIIDDPTILATLKGIDPDLDARGVIQQEINALAKNDNEVARIIPFLDFNGDGEIGGEDIPETPPADLTPAPAPVAPAPAPVAPAPAPMATAPMPAPVAESSDEDDVPFEPPFAKVKGTVVDKSGAKHTPMSKARDLARHGLLKAIQNAKKAGADLDTELDFGHKKMTIKDAIEECNLTIEECGFEEKQNPVDAMLETISGFWNPKEKNFTIGGTRAKIKIVKAFEEGAFEGATEHDVRHVCKLIDKLDPSGNEHNQIMRLAGVHHDKEVNEDPTSDEFDTIMKQFNQRHPEANVDSMIQQWQQQHPNATVTRNQNYDWSKTQNGKTTTGNNQAGYNDIVNQFKNMKLKFGNQEIDPSNPDSMKNAIGGVMKGVQGQAPNQNIQFPGGQMNPQAMMKDIMGRMNFGNE